MTFAMFPTCSGNQTLPSGPAVGRRGRLFAVGIGNSVMAPAGVTTATWLALFSVNQTFPSDPLAIPPTPALGVGIGNSPSKRPPVVIRPMLLLPGSPIHRLPSDPTVMLLAPRLGVGGRAYPVNPPLVVTFQILFCDSSVTQRFPSGPAVMAIGSADAGLPGTG